MAIYRSAPGSRLQQSGQHAQRSGFTGAVGPEQTEDLAIAHFERNVIHHRALAALLITENLGEILDLNHRSPAMGEAPCGEYTSAHGRKALYHTGLTSPLRSI